MVNVDPLRGMQVLLAEDNRTNQLVIEKFLLDTPLTLSLAKDGKEAVEMTAAQAPDVVLMDMAMPEMDGIEATRAIRAADGPQPIIIALTANAFESDRDTCLDAGMDGFLSKPVRRNQLLRELVRAAQNAEARSAAE